MATRKTKQDQAADVQKALLPSDQPERFKLSEIGYSGLSVFNGLTNDELYRELTFPNSIKTYKQMSYHSSVASCLSLFENLISKVSWRVVEPEEATAEEKKQTQFVNECLHDMDIPLRQVVKDALSSNVYGFSVLEKVYRKRVKSTGSIYDDGKIGIKKIALRNQESIEKFIFSEDGNEILGVKQNLSGVTYGQLRTKNEVVIPRHKYIHITTGRNREDPYGKSLLKDAYLAYRYLTVIEELEATGISKDLSGIPVMKIPAQYLSGDASPEQKQAAENFKNIVRNVQMNSQSGIVIPSDVNPETRHELFKFELLAVQGNGKSYDTEKIKNYYQSQIYTALGADVLILGNTGVGSFALGQLKSSLTGAAIEAMLDNIVEAFNRDLIRQLYELNGWDVKRTCKLDYDDLHATDLEGLSKAYQRMGATGFLPKTEAVINRGLTALGIDPLPEGTNLDEILPEKTTRSGDSFSTSSGGLNGTAEDVAGSDTSSLNSDNTA